MEYCGKHQNRYFKFLQGLGKKVGTTGGKPPVVPLVYKAGHGENRGENLKKI